VGLRAAPQVLGIWPWTVNFGSPQWLWAGQFSRLSRKAKDSSKDNTPDVKEGVFEHQAISLDFE